MSWIVLPEAIGKADLSMVGGKAMALADLMRSGFAVPPFVAVSAGAYQAFVGAGGLREKILLELNRKDFKLMRWEEVWDCATRIRNFFLRAPLPPDLAEAIAGAVDRHFGDTPVAVRSSAPDEDAGASSFAGLHDSYIHVRGAVAVVEAVRKVWASLWSDAALLYRQELGLDVARSAMAVVIQKMVAGQVSGIAFSQNPTASSQVVVEAVHGLNQGLVDGAVAPDRWIFDRQNGQLLEHQPAARDRWAVAVDGGVLIRELEPALADTPPLDLPTARAVVDLAMKAEAYFKTPQDVEWTLADRRLFVLQSRPITAGAAASANDQRAWYLSLHRSFDNLKALRHKIETEHVPGMIRAAEALGAMDLAGLDDGALAEEIRRRWQINSGWVDVYWSDFIPFAHGIRLFGQVYNDTLKPADPYEFIDLLTSAGLAGLERNRLLEDLAVQVRRQPELADCLTRGDCGLKAPEFRQALEDFVGRFGDLSCSLGGAVQCEDAIGPLAAVVLAMAKRPRPAQAKATGPERDAMVAHFLAAFAPQKRSQAEELLDLARASYKLRDDDNILIGRIEARLFEAVAEGRRRLALPGEDPNRTGRARLRDAVESAGADSRMHGSGGGDRLPDDPVRPRQLVGQPAGPGVARGPARVVATQADLAAFAHGDILVCDAVDPNMTFIVPLAAAVVERRGGMLIHGAIIAREYGLPCVTGVPDAARLIHTGDWLTVDGFLGIVTVGHGDL